MADQKIKVKVYGEWANLPELLAQLDELKKQNVNKRGKQIPLSKESQALEAEVRRKGADIEKRRQNGASPADLATDTFNFLLEFKKLITSMLNVTEKAKKELNDLETEVARLQIQQADKQKQLNQTLSKGVLNESGVLEPTKKARQELVRGEQIKNRSGGRGEFYSTQDVEKLARIMQELLDRAAKIEADPKAAETEKVKAGELKTDAAHIADVITKLNTFETDLTKEYKTLSDEVAKLNSTLSSKQAGVQAAIEGSDAPEKDIEKLVLKQQLNDTGEKVSEKITENLKEESEAQQDVNKNAEKSIEIDDQKRGSIGKLLTSFFGYQMALRALRKLWNDAIQTIQKLDAALTEQAIVSSLNRKEAWDLVKSYQALAKETGFTTTAIAEVATQYFRQGKTTREVMILTEAAAKSAKVASIDAKQAVDYLTTALNGFGLAAENAMAVSDKFAALAASSATSYEELAISLSKVASQANLAGMSINYTLGLLAKGIETTREPAESIGTALKTIIARMRELTDYGATLEDGMDLNNVEKQLAYINIELRGQDGQLRSTEEVLDQLGKRWKDLTTNQQASIAKALAGTRQQARLIAMMNDYERTLELVALAEESAGATQAQQVEYMQSLEASQKRLATAYEAFVTALVDNDLIKAMIDLLAETIERFAAALSSGDKSASSVTRQIATWGALLVGIGALLVPLLSKNLNKIGEIFLALKNTKTIENEKLRLISLQNMERKLSLQLLEKEQLIGKQLAGQKLTKQEAARLIGLDTEIDQNKAEVQLLKSPQTAEQSPEYLKQQKQAAMSSKIQGAMMIIAGAMAVISFIIDSIKRIQNAAAEAAQEVIEKNTELQAAIYENNRVIGTIKKLTKSFDELNNKLIKTSKDWDEIENIRQQLLEQFKAEDRQSMENMRVEELASLATGRATELEAENVKKLAEMEKNIKKASGSANWETNIVAGLGAGAALGAGIGAVAGAPVGGIGAIPGAAIGSAIGGIVGALAGIGVSIAEQVEKSNAKKVIKEMLKSEDGLAQARYLYSQQMKNLTSEYGIQGERIRSIYEGLLQTLDAKEFEQVLIDSGLTAAEYAANMAKILKTNYAEVSALTDSSTSYSDKIEALNVLLSSDMPAEMKDGLKLMYGELLDLTNQFPTSIKYLDQFGWSLDQLNKFVTALEKEGLNPDEWMNTIGTVLNSTGTVEDKLALLGGSMKGLSADAISAIADLIAAGRTLQSVTEAQTSTSSRIKNIRSTQGKWGSMSATEQSSFISENMGLFMTNGEWDEEKFQRFIQGMDISGMLTDYMNEEQAKIIKDYEDVLLSLNLELQAQQKALLDPEATEEDIAIIEKQIEALKGEIAATTYLAEGAQNMFDLTLDEMVKQQQEQLSLYKDMLEAEKDALIESLEKRKDAYQDYFDAINKQYETQDYEEQKAKLESQILKLTGATDAAAMMKKVELETQLADLEKERGDTLRQNAQTAVLESIDTQIEDTNEKYDKMLENDAHMLKEMSDTLAVDKAAYELQYWNYLQTLGLSEEAKQQQFQEFQTTFSGGIPGTGIPFIPTFSTPDPATPTMPETNNNYSFNINGRAVEFTNNETKQLNELIRAALKRVGVNIGI